MKFEEVKKDYLGLMDVGVPEDMGGGFVEAEHMERVVRNPTKNNAKKYMIDVIHYGFQMGEFWRAERGDISISDNDFLKMMYEKYIL